MLDLPAAHIHEVRFGLNNIRRVMRYDTSERSGQERRGPALRCTRRAPCTSRVGECDRYQEEIEWFYLQQDDTVKRGGLSSMKYKWIIPLIVFLFAGLIYFVSRAAQLSNN